MRVRTVALLLLSVLACTTCGVHAIAKHEGLPSLRIVAKDQTLNWQVLQLPPQYPDQFVIISATATPPPESVKSICTKEYVCFEPTAVGRIFVIERKRK